MSNNIVTQLPPTLGVKDPETRAFLDALVNHLELRGGNTNQDSPERFVTLGELQASINGRSSSLSMLGGGSGGTGPGGPPTGGGGGGTVEELIGRLEEWIRKGFLYQFLQSPIQYIDTSSFRDISDAGIQTESYARSNKDNAIAGAVNTIWAAIGGSEALIQDGQLASVSPAAVSATKWTQLQTKVSGLDGLPSSVAQVRQDFETYASTTDDTLRAAYGVRLEVSRSGQRVAGGFGIVAEAGSGGNLIDFGVAADRFWIAPPTRTSDGGDANAIANPTPTQFPFIALSAAQTVGGVTYQPGVYIRNANIANAAIDTAKIKDLSVDTLKIAGNAITRTQLGQSSFSSVVFQTTPWSVEQPADGSLSPVIYNPAYWTGLTSVEVFVPYNALTSGNPVRVAITYTGNLYPVDGSGASVVLGVAYSPSFGNINIIGQAGATGSGGAGFSLTGIAYYELGTPGVHTFILGARLQAGPSGNWSPPGGKAYNGIGSLLVQSAFR